VLSNRLSARFWKALAIAAKVINRKFFHIDKFMIGQDFIHRKKLYIDQEKDPHSTGMISTQDRK